VAAHLATLVESPDPVRARDAADKLGPFSVPIETSDGKSLFLVR